MRNDVNRLCLTCMQYTLDDSGRCGVCGAVDAGAKSPHHLPQRTVLGGKYLVAKVLGEGGFGITYLGWDINLEVKVAIKEYYPYGAVTRDTTLTDTVTALTGGAESFFAKGWDRFEDEARKLARFHTLPGIVSVRDYFLENGTAYIVMEFVEGVTLKDHLEQVGRRLSEEEALRLFQPLIQSLAQVHTVGIIHRDISPDNLMLTPAGQLRLLDFGAARDFSDLEKSLSVLLKPGYAPEEQYRSRGRQGPWTDIYALSATIFRTIEGQKPLESMERVIEDEFVGFTVPVSENTNTVLMKGLEIRQENRWQNLDDMYAALYGVPVEGYTLPTAAGVTTPAVENQASVPSPALAEAAVQAAQTPTVPQGGQQGAGVKTATKQNIVPLFVGIAVVVVAIIVLAVLLGGGGAARMPYTYTVAPSLLNSDDQPTDAQMREVKTLIEDSFAEAGLTDVVVDIKGKQYLVGSPEVLDTDLLRTSILPSDGVDVLGEDGETMPSGNFIASAEYTTTSAGEHIVRLQMEGANVPGGEIMNGYLEAMVKNRPSITIRLFREYLAEGEIYLDDETGVFILNMGSDETGARAVVKAINEDRIHQPFNLYMPVDNGDGTEADVLATGPPPLAEAADAWTGGEEPIRILYVRYFDRADGDDSIEEPTDEDVAYQTALFAVEEINAAGGLHGHQVELSWAAVPLEEGAMDAAITAHEADAVLVSSHSPREILEYDWELDVPILTHLQLSDEELEGSPGLFSILPAPVDEGRVMAYYARAALNADRVGCLYQDEVTSNGEHPYLLAENFINLTMTLEMDLPNGANVGYKNWSGQFSEDEGVTEEMVRQVVDAEVEAIYLPLAYHLDVQDIMAWLSEAGYTGVVLGGDTYGYVGSPQAKRTSYFNFYSQGRIAGYMQRFKAVYGNEFSSQAFDYEAIYLLCGAINAAGTTEFEAVCEAMGGLEAEGLTGEVRYDNGNRWPYPLSILKNLTE